MKLKRSWNLHLFVFFLKSCAMLLFCNNIYRNRLKEEKQLALWVAYSLISISNKLSWKSRIKYTIGKPLYRAFSMHNLFKNCKWFINHRRIGCFHEFVFASHYLTPICLRSEEKQTYVWWVKKVGQVWISQTYLITLCSKLSDSVNGRCKGTLLNMLYLMLGKDGAI